MHSFEIEGLEKGGKKLEGVVVGEIMEVKKHPNADKLQLAKVDIGSEILGIVCGAKNIAPGQKVPVATVGTKLPNGLIIKEAEIRGEKSHGMLCAQDELGLGTDHSGIMILPRSAKLGEAAAKYLQKNTDTMIEIKVLPDRAHDILSHVGVAREIAVLEGRKFDYVFDELELPKKKSVGTGRDLSVRIEDKDLCRRYIGAVMEDIVIKESPDWMKARLETCGLRPINNVVDATNYVMLELGQPLHAFDAEKIKVQKSHAYRQAGKSKMTMQNEKCNIVVRRARNNEELILLDDSRIKLNENNLLITNGDDALALAGIMGGKDSGISQDTKTIVLEVASFNATNIRRTRAAHNLRTDSSDRFEKDLDPNLCEKALVRIIEILEHTADGKLAGIVDVYPKKIKPWTVKLDLEYVNKLLGETVPAKDVVKILSLLGIGTENEKQRKGNGDAVTCIIPTQRIDLRTQEDLIEEIGRVRGYEKIKERPLIGPVLPAALNEQVFFERKIQDALTGAGADEMYNYSFYGADDLEKTGLEAKDHLRLSNPLSPEQEYVRTTLVPNILKNVRKNLKHFPAFTVFEIGKCYASKAGRSVESRQLALAEVLERDIDSEAFFSLKGRIENLLETLGAKGAEFLPVKKADPFFDPARTAEITVNGKVVGFIGEIGSAVSANYKIAKRVAVAELDTEMLRAVTEKTIAYHPINRFPVVSRDVSMVVPKNVAYAQITEMIRKTGGASIDSVSLFDRFAAKNSLAIRIEMSAKDRTLESAEIDAMMERIISGLEKLGIEVRK